jgi:hypothetical protein
LRAQQDPGFLETENWGNLLESHGAIDQGLIFRAKKVILKAMIEIYRAYLTTNNADMSRLAAKLNELDAGNTSMLERAIVQHRIECVALLLQNGFELRPEMKSHGHRSTSAWVILRLCEQASQDAKSLREIRGLMDFHCFAATNSLWVSKSSSDTDAIVQASLKDLQNGKITSPLWSHDEDELDGDMSTWIHVPETNVRHLNDKKLGLVLMQTGPRGISNHKITPI